MESDSSLSPSEETTISYPASLSPSPLPSFNTITNTSKQQMQINVIFRKVEESYAVESDIEVCYTILGEFEVTARDWIGLYKVGWRSQHDYVFYDWSPFHQEYSKDKEIQNKVIFAGSKMPKEDGDFYQFCYVTSSGQVQGASTPFQFKVLSDDDLVVEEEKGEIGAGEDGGLMIVKTRKDQMQDKVKKIKFENLAMTEKLMSLETQLEMGSAREHELKKSLEKMKESQDAYSSLNEERGEELTETRQQNEYLQGCIGGMQERMDVLNQEKTSMERRLDDSDGYISSLQDKIKNLVVEKDLLQGKINLHVEENLAIKNYSRHMLLECEEKNRKMKISEKEMSVQLAKCSDDLKKLKTSMAYLSDKLQNSEDKLGAAEHCKKMLNEEVVMLKDKLELIEVEREECGKKRTLEMNEKLKEIEAKDIMIKEKDRQSEAINAQLREYDIKLGGKLVDEVKAQLEGLNSKLEDKEKEVEEKDKRVIEVSKRGDELRRERERILREMHELEDSLYALQTAHKVLLQRLAAQNKKQDVSELIKKEEERKDEERKDDEIESLKKRLHVCAEMYKQKCLENFSKSPDYEKARNNGSISAFDLVDSSMPNHDTELKRKVTEQEKQILELTERLANMNSPLQFQEERIDSGHSAICEEERFVDALNVTEDDEEAAASRSNDVTNIRSCPFCPVVFEEGVNEVAMTSHVEEHMPEDKLNCPICHAFLNTDLDLIRHTESHFE